MRNEFEHYAQIWGHFGDLSGRARKRVERARSSWRGFVNCNDSVLCCVLVEEKDRQKVHPCQSTAMAGERRHRARFAIVAARRVDTAQDTSQSSCYDCESVCDTTKRLFHNSQIPKYSTSIPPPQAPPPILGYLDTLQTTWKYSL
jgi:hypothetical protein